MSIDIESLGVFQIFTGGGTGTGFLLSDKLLLTNCHVVAPYRKVAVEKRDKQRILGTVRRLHPKRDLAIVELSEPLAGEVLAISTNDDLKPKQPLHIIGYPVGLPLSITEGVISNPNQQFGDQRYVQTDAAINPGNSGGPILDENKQVVAVTTCKLRSGDMIGFGIPAPDVREFVSSFEGQNDDFGVMCTSCDALLTTAERYCNGCGADLEDVQLEHYFDPPEEHPIVKFVEGGLQKAGIDPLLARHGEENWSFHSGSAPIKIWSCCSDHLNFSSPLAQIGKQNLGELFRFLLSGQHAPFSFDMYESTIRLNLVFHMTDVHAHAGSDEVAGWISKFMKTADDFDNLLVDKYGCQPAPDTQVTFLKEQSSRDVTAIKD
jgi:serine protease Do